MTRILRSWRARRAYLAGRRDERRAARRRLLALAEQVAP